MDIGGLYAASIVMSFSLSWAAIYIAAWLYDALFPRDRGLGAGYMEAALAFVCAIVGIFVLRILLAKAIKEAEWSSVFRVLTATLGGFLLLFFSVLVWVYKF